VARDASHHKQATDLECAAVLDKRAACLIESRTVHLELLAVVPQLRPLLCKHIVLSLVPASVNLRWAQ
jgi:hypothetical protein